MRCFLGNDLQILGILHKDVIIRDYDPLFIWVQEDMGEIVCSSPI